MAALADLLECVSGLGDVLEGLSSAADLYEFLSGSGGSDALVDAIAGMEQTISTDIEQLIAALQDETWEAQWAPFSAAIDAIQTTTSTIAQQFATLVQAGTGYTIDTGNVIPLQVWAEGGTYDGLQYSPGALEQMRSAAETLWKQFQVGDVLTPSILDVWIHLFKLGPASAVQNFAGQTQLTAYFLMQQQILGMLSAIFYLHEGILGMYCKTYGNLGNFSSLGPYVKVNFGDINTPGSVWNQFENVMAVWPPLLEDYDVIATSGDSWNGPDAFSPINPGPFGSGGANFWNQWTLVPSTVPNAFFTGIQIQMDDASQVSAFPNYYLVGIVSIIGPGAEITVQQTNVTSYDPAQATVPENQANLIFLNKDFLGYVNVGYSVAPQPLPPGRVCYNVVTGFRLSTVFGNRLGIQLNYGLMDLTDPSHPVVTDQGQAQLTPGNEYFGVEGNSSPEVDYIDLRPSALSGTVIFPIDNISFIQTFPTAGGPGPTGAGNRIGLLVRSGWNVFQAPFMQPTNVLVRNAYIPPPDQ